MPPTGGEQARQHVNALLVRPLLLLIGCLVAAAMGSVVHDFMVSWPFRHVPFRQFLPLVAGIFSPISLLALAGGVMLVFVDRATTPSFRGDRLVLGTLAAVGAVAVLANISVIVDTLYPGSPYLRLPAPQVASFVVRDQAPVALAAGLVWLVRLAMAE